ncbi:MAG: AbrB/MazE/SpoVT family DNA-binding domain-containing protein [Candidatus Poribacteria bacterium]|nr:AbrB/MazE/SpoVT family DNA-binding domain-containing protein [Candidatus Poribacteria bacterium]
MTLTVKVSKKYQISIPKAACRDLNITPGDRLLVEIRDGRLVLIPEPEDYVQALAGLHREVWEDTHTGEYLKGERNAWVDS